MYKFVKTRHNICDLQKRIIFVSSCLDGPVQLHWFCHSKEHLPVDVPEERLDWNPETGIGSIFRNSCWYCGCFSTYMDNC